MHFAFEFMLKKNIAIETLNSSLVHSPSKPILTK